MKKVLFLVLIAFSSIIKAQSFDLQQGDIYETPSVVWSRSGIESDSTGFYFIRNKNGIAKVYTYHKIDRKTGKTLYIKDTDFSFDGKAYNCNGKLLFFNYKESSGIADIKKKISLSMTEVDSYTGGKIGETIDIDYLETKNGRQYVDIDISFSPDKTKLLVTSEIKEEKKVQTVVCRLYNINGYKKIWEKEPLQVYKNSTVSSSQYRVDNQGNLCYVFGYVRSDHKDVLGNYDNVNYAIVMASANNANVQIKEIKAENRKIENIQTEIVGDKYISSGQFSDGEFDIGDNAKRGFFIVSINPNDFSVEQSFIYLDEKIEDKVINQKEKYGNNIKWTNSKIFSINNTYYVVKQRIRPSPPATIDEILVIKYSHDFKYEWMKLIPKFSYADKENAINFLVTDKLNFIYYDNIKNLKKFPNTDSYDRMEYVAARYDKDSIIYATINDAGIVTRKVLDVKDQILLEDQDFKDYHGNYLKAVVLPVRISNKRKRYDILSVK